MSNLKKVFTSDKEDRGLFVKILKNKVSLSFWGDDNPNKIALSNEEAKAMCSHILDNINKEELGEDKQKFYKQLESAYKEVKRRTPHNQNL